MGKVEITNTLEEISDNKPLNLDDFEGFAEVSIAKIPLTKYRFEFPAKTKFAYDGHNFSQSSREIEIDLDCLKKVKVPVLKGRTTVGLATSWNLAQMYIDKAKSYDLYDSVSGEGYSEYQRTVILYKYAFDSYKTLIEELLPYFTPESRDTVRCRMLRETACYAASQACSDLEYGLRCDIDFHIRWPLTRPKALIESWEYLISLVSAISIESEHYERIDDAYRYDKYCSQIQSKKIPPAKYPPSHPSNPKYENIGAKNRATRITKAKKVLAGFYNARKITGIVPEGVTTDTISVTVPRLLLLSARAQKMLASLCACVTPVNEENSPLLNYLDGYIPQYIQPKDAPANSVDHDIIRLEKDLADKVEAFDNFHSSYEDLLSSVNDGIKLLSLLHMRYRIFLNDKDDSYFGIFESNKNINAKQYYRILEIYIERIITVLVYDLQKAITDPNQEINHSQVKPSTQVINNASEIATELRYYFYEAEALNSDITRKTISLLKQLFQNTLNISLSSLEQTTQNNPLTTLRRRSALRYETT